jgi:hypothetical protein
MYGKIVSLSFKDMNDAQLGASFFSEHVGTKIFEHNINGFNIFIGRQGELNIAIKFKDSAALKHFESRYSALINDLRASLPFKEQTFVGVCAFTFEKEAAMTEARTS